MGGRHHEPATEAVAQLADAVRETVDGHGVLLIPSFAVGRTQEPQRVFLVHGDPEASSAIEPKVRALGRETYRPGWREVVAHGGSATAPA
jgi:predicted metal-dependent RNase